MDELARAARKYRNPVMVGLDPRWENLPEGLRDLASDSDSSNPADDDLYSRRAKAYQQFCCEIIDVVAPLVPAVKPQSAFFEELGPAGMQALAAVIVHARQQGLIVILDAKRGDIGSTAAAYARGILGRTESAWGADAVTVNPYLGDESLHPFVKVAMERGAGLFVLVKTSNPGGGMFQDLVLDEQADKKGAAGSSSFRSTLDQGEPLYGHVANLVESLADQTRGDCGYGAVGAVVGATYPQQLAKLRTTMPQTWFLVPGFGSQGGTAQDVAAAFDSRGLGAIVNSSRGIIFAHQRPEYAQRFGSARWQEAVEAATREMIAELRAETPAGKLRVYES
ncbi:MAG: orotidine-5'-phosphate decarboxylase [Pirellulales bacterium]